MELKIVKFFNRLGRGTVVDKMTDFVSRILYLTLLWAVVGISFLLFDRINGMEMFIAFAIGSAAYFVFSEGIFRRLVVRYIFKRTRPYIACPAGIIPIGREHGSTSFPSSHMTTTLFMLAIACFYHPGFFWISLVFVIFMAFARLHNGMHYPSDLLAGTILGIMYGMAGIYLAKYLAPILEPSFDFLKIWYKLGI